MVVIPYRQGLHKKDVLLVCQTKREVFYGVISQEVALFLFMGEEKICSFFGHSEICVTDSLYQAVEKELSRLITQGYRTFYFGGFGQFDALCYQIVTKIKIENPSLSIKRVFCVWQERYLSKKSPHFKREDYDEIIYLPPAFDGWYKSIYFRNCAMIDASDCILFYAQEREDSGAYKAYKYAKKKKDKTIFNLYA